jgi:ApaG protein
MGNRAAQRRRDLLNPVGSLFGMGLHLVSWESTMPDLGCDPAPLSDAVTDDIRVEVMSSYSPENSRPLEGEWVFQYTVRITNQGPETVQLLSRHWLITDAAERIEEIKGPGVVGKQPVLAPGESFKYSSWCPLKTPMGVMYGTFEMARADGIHFDVEIAPFGLKARYTVH